MHNSTSPADIRILAERFRQMAHATALSEYSQLMIRVALELEQRTKALESPDGVVSRRQSAQPDTRALTTSFGDTITLLSA